MVNICNIYSMSFIVFMDNHFIQICMDNHHRYSTAPLNNNNTEHITHAKTLL